MNCVIKLTESSDKTAIAINVNQISHIIPDENGAIVFMAYTINNGMRCLHRVCESLDDILDLIQKA